MDIAHWDVGWIRVGTAESEETRIGTAGAEQIRTHTAETGHHRAGTAHIAVHFHHFDIVQWNHVGRSVHWDLVHTAHTAEGHTVLLLLAVTQQDLWRRRHHLEKVKIMTRNQNELIAMYA